MASLTEESLSKLSKQELISMMFDNDDDDELFLWYG